MGPEFFQTRMGQQFFEGTMPSIARNLATISEGIGLARSAMERLAKAMERQNELKEFELGLRTAKDTRVSGG